MTSSKPHRPPRKHHYIPEFYLKRWAGADGKLIEFRRRFQGQVAPRPTHAGGTGYYVDLYTAPDERHVGTAKLESNFLAPADDAASEALALLYKTGVTKAWTSAQRSAWSRFILTLLLRSPEDIEQLKSNFERNWAKITPEMEAGYLRRRRPEDPETFAEAIGGFDRGQLESMALSLAPSLMDHDRLGARFNHMRWRTIQFEGVKHELLTSDRPVLMSATLTEEYAYIIVPIGPSHLFVAVNDDQTFEFLHQREPNDLIAAVNEIVVQHAKRFVWGRNSNQLRFIQNRMGTQPEPSLMERIARMRGLKEPQQE